ncbi:hypothetical protein D7V93_30350 [Corallococcus llansteffanensis]|uniref:Uncharacterized protein n=1 Tax=Corallococcus llansteffanensis TaxID=2316731 RepID=A0A3A8PAR9_9BACT|nr:hypothetical protein D7V93_30350 [Corallococcus llansteffanensis]
MKDFLDFLRSLSPSQALTAMAVMMTVVLLAMVWRAWTFHYPEPAQPPAPLSVPSMAVPPPANR